MSNGFLVITEKDWEKADAEQRAWLMFNTLQSMDTRISKLEKRPIIDKFCSVAGGVIGGALATLGFKIA